MVVTVWITVVTVLHDSGSESFTVLHPNHADVLAYATNNLASSFYESLVGNKHSRCSWSFEDREGVKHDCFTEHKELKLKVVPF